MDKITNIIVNKRLKRDFGTDSVELGTLEENYAVFSYNP